MIESLEINRPVALLGVQFFSSEKKELSLKAAWKYFEEIVPEIPNKISPYETSKSYAICYDFNFPDLNGFTYFIGIPVSDLTTIPDFAVAKAINPGKYYRKVINSVTEIESSLNELRNRLREDRNGRSHVNIEIYYPDNSSIEVLLRDEDN